jgi:exonuclease III
MSLEMLCLNVRAGGGRQAAALTAYLEEQRPGVLVLTEWRDNAVGTLFKRWATGHGMHITTLTDGQTLNGVFVASRTAFASRSVTPPGGRAGVLLLGEFADCLLLACYFPQGQAKAPFFERCTSIASGAADRPFLMLGDLNTGNQQRDRVLGSSPYHCSAAFDGLVSEHGLVDLWRRTNGDLAREWTWFSNRGNTRNGFRLDHAFANKSFLDSWEIDCCYDHRPRESSWTDHSAIKLSLMPHKAQLFSN